MAFVCACLAFCLVSPAGASVTDVASAAGTWIRSDQADTIQDNTNLLIGYSSTARFHALLEFDLSGIEGQVTAVSLGLSKVFGGSSAAGNSTIEVLPLLTSFNGYRVAERATWNNRSTGPAQPWQTPGADGVGFDRGDTVLASLTASESLTAAGALVLNGNADFRALVQANLGGTLRCFVRVAGDYASNGRQVWGLGGPFSATVSQRPVLTVQTAVSQSILVTPSVLSVAENGGTATFEVTLSSPPVTNLALRVDSEDVAEITAAPQSLAFNAGNWNVPQTVTVTGVNDSSLLGAAGVAVRVSYDSGDAGFATAAPGAVQVSIVDDEATVDYTIYVDAAAAAGGNGSLANPYNTLAAGLAAAQGRGDRVKVSLAAGTYREGGASLMNRNLLTIVEGASDGETVISGSEIWTGWTADGANYYKTWTSNWGLEPVRPEATVSDEGRRSEMIFVNGVLMRQVASLGALTARAHFGTYYVDETADRIYLRPPTGIDPNTAQVEVAVRRNLVQFYQNSNLVLRNLVFQHSAAADHSSWPNTYAVALAGGNDGDPQVNASPDGSGYTRELLIDNCTFRWNNSEGLQANLMQGYIFRNTRFIHNGKGGLGTSRSRYGLWEGCTFAHNNWRWGLFGGEYGWAPAGVKALKSSHITVRDSRFVGNYANGLWFDYGNEALTVERVLSVHNWGVGLYYEANLGPLAVSRSLIRNNGIVPAAQDNFWTGGLLFAESKNLTVSNSYLIDNNYAQLDVRSTNRNATMYWSGQTFDGLSRDWIVEQSVLRADRNETKAFPPEWLSSIAEGAIYAPSPTSGNASSYKDQAVPSFSGAGNRYFSATATKAFHPGLSTDAFYREPLANWQSATGTDVDATWGNVDALLEAFDYFAESNGTLVIEAENTHSNRRRSDSAGWKVSAGYEDLGGGVLGATGTGYLLASDVTPGVAGAFATAMQVSYRVNITTEGSYSLAARRYAASGNSDSIWIAVDGVQVGDTSNGEVTGTTSGWQWSSPVALGTLTPGIHEITLVRREGGLLLDRLMLAADTADLPAAGSTATGPEETPLNTPPAAANEVTISALAATVREDAASATFRFSRNFQSGALTVNYSIGGTATPGADFTAPGTSVVIPDGLGYVDVTVSLLDDTEVERDESLTLNVGSGSGYEVGAPASGTTTILANDLVSHTAITAAQAAGTSQTVWITLHNPYDSPLTFTLPDGSLENLNYTSLTSDDAGGPAYVWNDISASGTRISGLNGWDNAISTITLPFPFTYFGTTVNSLQVSTNGLLQAPQGSSNAVNWPLPYQYGQGAIAPFWDDLQNTNGIFTASPDADTFVVQWHNSVQKSTNRQVSFQVHLKRSGEIFFYYKTLNSPTSTYTTGIQNGDFNNLPDKALQLAYNSAFAKDNFAVRIYSEPAWLNSLPTNNAAVVPPNSSLIVGYQLNSASLVNGQSFTENLSIQTNNSQTESFPLSFTINVGPLAAGSVEAWLWTEFGTTVATGEADWTLDPEGDGWPTILEYVLLGDPLNTDSGLGGNLEFSSPTDFSLQFLRREPCDFPIRIMQSGDLSEWTKVAEYDPDTGNWINYGLSVSETGTGTVRDVSASGSLNGDRSFLRIEVPVP